MPDDLPNFDALRSAIESAPSHLVIRVHETMYRSTTPQYATESDLVTGEGSKKVGGRWNPIGLAAVYASRTPETAMREALAHFRYYGLPIENSMPRVFVALAITLSAVLDLAAEAACSRLGLPAEALTRVDWRAEMHAGREPITQMVGRAVHAAGLEGMLVPSSADSPGGVNVLAFPNRFRAGSRVVVRNAAKLRA